MYGFSFSAGVFSLFIFHCRYIDGDNSIYGPQYLDIYYGLRYLDIYWRPYGEGLRVPFYGGKTATVSGAWECVFVRTLVYVCLSVIEGPTGAVQIPMRMGVRAVCSHMCVSMAWVWCLLVQHTSRASVSMCVCACVHTSTCT